MGAWVWTTWLRAKETETREREKQRLNTCSMCFDLKVKRLLCVGGLEWILLWGSTFSVCCFCHYLVDRSLDLFWCVLCVKRNVTNDPNIRWQWIWWNLCATQPCICKSRAELLACRFYHRIRSDHHCTWKMRDHFHLIWRWNPTYLDRDGGDYSTSVIRIIINWHIVTVTIQYWLSAII